MNESAPYTTTQRQRLIELGATAGDLDRSFDCKRDRDECFDGLSADLGSRNRSVLEALQKGTQRAILPRISDQLATALLTEGFTQVATPSFVSRGALVKMGISPEDELWEQVFWIDSKRCLRPMLAPNLYFLLGHLKRYWQLPIRLFEIGSCWRKDSKGSRHLEEFTMLNLVELGCPGDPIERLSELAACVMKSIGLSYTLEEEPSEVYGNTLDVVCNGVEIASGAVGPHPLDEKWHVTDSWAGLGVGVERAAMMAGGHASVHRVGRSLIYLDGARLNI